MRDYQNLKVWEKAHELALAVNATTAGLSKERSHLRQQMRRSAESIPTNIVEGCGRRSQKDFAHFLQISVGSCSELDYQLRLAKDYGDVPEQVWKRLSDQAIEVRKMLIGLIKKIRSDELAVRYERDASPGRDP